MSESFRDGRGDAAKSWVFAVHLGRRSVTPEMDSYDRGRRYNAEKRQGERTDLTSGHSDQKLDAADSLAREFGVSNRTIRRDGAFAAALDAITLVVPGVWKAALSRAAVQRGKDVRAWRQ